MGLVLPGRMRFKLPILRRLRSSVTTAASSLSGKVRPVVATHPITNENVWFNHAAFFHVSTLEPAVREALLANFAADELPYNTYYGDGSTIEATVLEEISRAYREEAVYFPWEKGDVLMLDNMLTAHGRASFVGPRKILAAMSEPHSNE